MTKDEALKMALEYIETNAHERRHVRWAIKEALAQPVQEPVACGNCNGSGRMVRDPDIGTDQECFVCDGAGVPAAPVQEPVAYAGVKVWVGNQQVVRLLTQTELHYAVEPWLLVELNAMKCVQALKEKNT